MLSAFPRIFERCSLPILQEYARVVRAKEHPMKFACCVRVRAKARCADRSEPAERGPRKLPSRCLRTFSAAFGLASVPAMRHDPPKRGGLAAASSAFQLVT